jgi:hypothetical protein
MSGRGASAPWVQQRTADTRPGPAEILSSDDTTPVRQFRAGVSPRVALVHAGAARSATLVVKPVWGKATPAANVSWPRCPKLGDASKCVDPTWPLAFRHGDVSLPSAGRGVGGSSRWGGFGRVAENEIQRRVVGLAGLYEGVISVLGLISALAPKRQM